MYLKIIDKHEDTYYHWHTLNVSLSTSQQGTKREIKRYTIGIKQTNPLYLKEGKYSYISRAVVIRYILSAESRIKDESLDALAKGETMQQILSKYFTFCLDESALNMQEDNRITSGNSTNTEISSSNSDINVCTCTSINTTGSTVVTMSTPKRKRTVDNDITEMKKRLRQTFSQAKSVEEFLK